MKTYFLPAHLREELRKPFGMPIFGKEKEVLEKFQKIVQKKKFKKIITIGDYCSLHLPSDIKIFDGKIKRKRVKKYFKFNLICQNPPGTIQKGVWPIMKRAIKNKENLFVEGEEDLLVIPAVLVSKKNTVIVYGFPEKGICLIEVSQKIKRELKKLLKKFNEEDLSNH